MLEPACVALEPIAWTSAWAIPLASVADAVPTDAEIGEPLLIVIDQVSFAFTGAPSVTRRLTPVSATAVAATVWMFVASETEARATRIVEPRTFTVPENCGDSFEMT